MKFKNKKRGFTLAEILITLSIIGVIAAILFPSILTNYNERTLKAKRQALVARMSQAMGELADKFADYEDTECDATGTSCTDKASALKFITEGLSKVYKISAVCDHSSLEACDIPSEITKVDGTTFNLKDYSDTYGKYDLALIPPPNKSYQMDGNYAVEFDTKSAGFMTKNGESILLFFYPRCRAKQAFSTMVGNGVLNTAHDVTACVNMIYDLNGAKKKPNRLNEDIGFMTVYYSNAPQVVSPKGIKYSAAQTYSLSTSTVTGVTSAEKMSLSYPDAKSFCHSLGDNVSLPSYEEMSSIAINYAIYGDFQEFKQYIFGDHTIKYWTSTPCAADSYVGVEIDVNYDTNDAGCNPITSNGNPYLLQFTCVINE